MMATCGLWVCGSWGGHRAGWVRAPTVAKVMKSLYSEDRILQYISILEKAVFSFTSLIPCESLRFFPYSTASLPRFTTHTKRLFQAIFQPIQRASLGAPAGGEASQSTCSICKPLAHHPDWQPMAHPCPRICWLRAWSLSSGEITSHLPWQLAQVSRRLRLTVSCVCVIYEY